MNFAKKLLYNLPLSEKLEKLFLWGHSKPWNDYSSFCMRKYGFRVQKISVNAGFSCPNRDGSVGIGGCSYCSNISFSPFYCHHDTNIAGQIKDGILFFEKKYKAMRFVAYFQTYTNTYASLDILRQTYLQALVHEKIVGLVISTRPDCLSREIFTLLAEIGKKTEVQLEIGIESTLDHSLKRVNRGHTFEDAKNAIFMAQEFDIPVGVHIILGLPGESRQDILGHATTISKLPVNSIKLHQLQVLKDTPIVSDFLKNGGDFMHFSIEEYIELSIDFLEVLNPELIVERFISESPPDLIISPKWNKIKNFEFVAKLEKRMKERNTWQGRLFGK